MSVSTYAIDARLIGGSNTGDSTYWTCLVDALSRFESNFELLLFSNAAPPKTIPIGGNIRWIQLPAKSSRWWSLAKFPLAARRAGASVIHTQYSLSPLAGRQGITTIHDVSFMIEPSWFRLRDRLILRATVPPSARRAAAIITVSKTSRREIEAHIPGSKGKISAIYNACPPWIRAMEREEAIRAVAKRFSIRTPYFLTVGTRWPRKNLALAVDAFRIVNEASAYQLALTGRFGWGAEPTVPNSRLTGYVDQDDLSALYSAADLFLIPSRHEGFGIPMLEAWRCGTPVLCSSGGALPEIAGNAAYVEESWQPAAWAATIEQILGDAGKLKSMRLLGEEREKQFSWDIAARETLALYREVAGGRA